MLTALDAPVPYGKDPSFINYDQQVLLRGKVANLDPPELAAARIRRTETVARQLCLATGSDVVTNNDGADRILTISQDYSAPDAVDSAHQGVARSFQFRRTNQTMDVNLAEFDLFRR